jgi:hypothetical protein
LAGVYAAGTEFGAEQALMALLAQERPPQVLLIVQERLKPNSVQAYDKNEREILSFGEQVRRLGADHAH